jgi:hypothetical protein
LITTTAGNRRGEEGLVLSLPGAAALVIAAVHLLSQNYIIENTDFVVDFGSAPGF